MTKPVVPTKPVLVTVEAAAPPPPPIPAVSIEALIAPYVIHSDIVIKTVRVTPELAQTLLGYNLPGNRNTPNSAIARLARIIGTPRWRLNGEALKVSVENLLIDGQTRLRACVASGRPFDTVILFGLPTSAYDSQDQGRKRKVADALTRHAVPHARITAAAIIAIDSIKAQSAPASGGRWVGTDADEALDFIKANPRVSASVTATAPASKLAPHSLLAALHFSFR